MKIENAIGWCDCTTNAVTGCTKISAGCAGCYAATGTRARVLRAQGVETWGPKGVRHPVAQFSEKIRRLNKLCVCDKCHRAVSFEHNSLPCHFEIENWKRCEGVNRRIRLFSDSNSDWLDDKWPIEVFANFLKEIHDAPNVDVLLLTKRPENFEDRLTAAAIHVHTAHCSPEHTELREWIDGWREGESPANVWLGVSVENQAMADLRIPQLIHIPAHVRFLSCEPLLEKVILEMALEAFHTFDPMLKRNPAAIDWVIVGGESGKNRRDCGVEAITDIADQCRKANVPVYVKQDVNFKSGKQGRIPDEYWRMKQFPIVHHQNS